MWIEALDHLAAAKLTEAVFRLSQGNFSNVKSVGGGIFERRINFGPGYRIYFAKDGERLIVLLGGSSKRNQQEAISTASRLWQDYQRRRR
jgi:putative addiction module killer protein